MKEGKTYIVSAYIEVEVCDCQDEDEALFVAVSEIDLGGLDYDIEEVDDENLD